MELFSNTLLQRNIDICSRYFNLLQLLPALVMTAFNEQCLAFLKNLLCSLLSMLYQSICQLKMLL